MSLKAGRVGVASDQVDDFGKIKSEATSGYTKQEADAKFQPLRLEVPVKYLNGSVLGTFNTVQEALSGSYGPDGSMTNRDLTEKVVPTTDVKNTVISTYCDTTNSIIDIVRIGNIVQVTAVVKVTTAIPAYTKFMEGLPNALFPSNGGDARVVNFFLFTGGSTHYRCYMDGNGNVNNHATQIPTGIHALSFMYIAQ